MQGFMSLNQYGVNHRLVPESANKATLLRGLTANERDERHGQRCTLHLSFAR